MSRRFGEAGAGTLSASSIKKSFDRRVVLGGVDATIAPGHRVGVVGPNGIGKSTLLRVLAGIERPDAGRVRRDPPGLSVGYLAQEPDARTGETVLHYFARTTGVATAEAEVDRLAARLDADVRTATAYDAALERFVSLGGGDLSSRAGAVLEELALGPRVAERPVQVLSAGQAARVQLAAILLARFDVLLLDEPTNNLDFDSLERLESFCAGLRGGLAVVSHDRAFLDRIATSILELVEPDHTAIVYAGAWSDYVRERELRRAQQYDAYGKYLGERDRLRQRVVQQRQWAERGVRNLKRDQAKKRLPRIVLGGKIDRTEKQASKIRATERQLERLERDRVEKPWEPWRLQLEIAAARRSGDLVARLERAVVRRGEFTLGPIDLEVSWGERVAILGPNGAGKTTLLQAMLGRLDLEAGTRYVGPGVVVGELDQTRSVLAVGRSLVTSFVEATGSPVDEARNLLAKFGLGAGHVVRGMESLSPGERTRATLALLMAKGVNCLVLDEPTNHLDLEAIEQLEAALDGYDATLLLVTHDRWLLDHVQVSRTVRL